MAAALGSFGWSIARPPCSQLTVWRCVIPQGCPGEPRGGVQGRTDARLHAVGRAPGCHGCAGGPWRPPRPRLLACWLAGLLASGGCRWRGSVALPCLFPCLYYTPSVLLGAARWTPCSNPFSRLHSNHCEIAAAAAASSWLQSTQESKSRKAESLSTAAFDCDLWPSGIQRADARPPRGCVGCPVACKSSSSIVGTPSARPPHIYPGPSVTIPPASLAASQSHTLSACAGRCFPRFVTHSAAECRPILLLARLAAAGACDASHASRVMAGRCGARAVSSKQLLAAQSQANSC